MKIIRRKAKKVGGTKKNNLGEKNKENEKNGKLKSEKKINEANIIEKLPQGVASIDKTEKIIILNEDKKKVTKIIKNMEDGSKQIETIKEILDE